MALLLSEQERESSQVTGSGMPPKSKIDHKPVALPAGNPAQPRRRSQQFGLFAKRSSAPHF
jgi:hypothetical protein